MNQALPFSVHALIVGVCLISRTFSASVSLAWDPDPDPDVIGYRIYYGPLNVKLQVADAGLGTSLKVDNLLPGLTYQFYATAYNLAGLESTPSTVITYAVPLVTTDPTIDTDGDGLPDAYETAHGLNPFDPTDAAADNDGDGLSNLQEYNSGTDPNDPGSSLRITVVQAQPGSIMVQFTSVVGLNYVLQMTDNFPSGPWTPLASIVGTGTELQFFDVSAGTSPERMYRIVTTALNQTQVSSEPAGFQRVKLRAQSDTITSTSLFRPSAFQGTVRTVGGTFIQMNGAQFVQNGFAYSPGTQTNTYFVLLRGGLREGESFIITGNTADAVNLQTYGDTLWGISPGDPISVIPFWTIGTIFPSGQGVLASTTPALRATEILIPNFAGDGINLPTSATYYFLNGFWRKVGDGAGNHNDDVVLPDMFFWVRQNTAAATDLILPGVALITKWRFPVYRNPNGEQDNIFAMPRATAVSLNDSGLIQSGAFRASTSPANRLDELLVFDNTAARLNKSASATYYYWNNAWRKIGGAGADAGADLVFTPGTGFIIRAGAGANATWVNPSLF